MYDETADSYAAMMDVEIVQPQYFRALSRLKEGIAGIAGAVVDTSCGPGHMLSMYRERLDQARKLVGIDLSPEMIKLSRSRLGPEAELVAGDMRNLDFLPDASMAGIISFFALHHLDLDGVRTALGEWARILKPG
ncbi:MAG: class I SAM-dependent methyltransferase, partial [Verrucomicrobiota bacterium]